MERIDRLIDDCNLRADARRSKQPRNFGGVLFVRETSVEPFQRIFFDRIYKIYRIFGVWGRVPR